MDISLLEVLGAFTLFFVILGVILHQCGWLKVDVSVVDRDGKKVE